MEKLKKKIMPKTVAKRNKEIAEFCIQEGKRIRKFSDTYYEEQSITFQILTALVVTAEQQRLLKRGYIKGDLEK